MLPHAHSQAGLEALKPGVGGGKLRPQLGLDVLGHPGASCLGLVGVMGTGRSPVTKGQHPRHQGSNRPEDSGETQGNSHATPPRLARQRMAVALATGSETFSSSTVSLPGTCTYLAEVTRHFSLPSLSTRTSSISTCLVAGAGAVAGFVSSYLYLAMSCYLPHTRCTV